MGEEGCVNKQVNAINYVRKLGDGIVGLGFWGGKYYER